MQPVRDRGKLTTWNDDRGFGFIQPDDGSQKVFLHISALKPAARRPHVGDTIFYEPVAQAEGKIRAFNASIAGVAVRPVEQKFTRRQRRLIETIVGVPVVAVVAFFVLSFDSNRAPTSRSAPQFDTPPSAPQINTAPPSAPQINTAPPSAPQMDTAPPPAPQMNAAPPTASQMDTEPQTDTAPQMDTAPPPGHTIKGNISVGTGDKLYHVPGAEDYEVTKIDPTRGERWFRSEEEAVANGWRKAPR